MENPVHGGVSSMVLPIWIPRNKKSLDMNVPDLIDVHCQKRILNSDATKLNQLSEKNFGPIIHGISYIVFNLYEVLILRTIYLKFSEYLDCHFFRPVIRLLLHLNWRFSFYSVRERKWGDDWNPVMDSVPFYLWKYGSLIKINHLNKVVSPTAFIFKL